MIPKVWVKYIIPPWGNQTVISFEEPDHWKLNCLSQCFLFGSCSFNTKLWKCFWRVFVIPRKNPINFLTVHNFQIDLKTLKKNKENISISIREKKMCVRQSFGRQTDGGVLFAPFIGLQSDQNSLCQPFLDTVTYIRIYSYLKQFKM